MRNIFIVLKRSSTQQIKYKKRRQLYAAALF